MTSLARAIATLVVIASIARAGRVVELPLSVEHVRLRNGLEVILAPDDDASSVAVHLRYATGARSERAGEAGYTYLLAKLMNAGSVHVKDFDARLEAAGGWSTAEATHDYLATTTQVPAHALDQVLWLEAERMAGLADGMTAEAVAKAREAVKAEWRAAYVEDPFALATRELQRTLWTDRFAAYGSPVLGDGYASHVANVGALRLFARSRLAPNNAILVVAGKLDRVATRRLVERYFGWMPMREAAFAQSGDLFVAPRDGAVEVTVKDPVPKVIVAFRAEYEAPFRIAAHVLGSGETARLRRLVKAGLATDVHTELVLQHAGELRITATPAPGVDPKRLAAAMRAEVAALRAAPLEPDELERAKAQITLEQFLAIENLAVRAELLASWETYGGGDYLASGPGRVSSAQARDIHVKLQGWLGDQSSVTVIGQPEGP